MTTLSDIQARIAKLEAENKVLRDGINSALNKSSEVFTREILAETSIAADEIERG